MSLLTRLISRFIRRGAAPVEGDLAVFLDHGPELSRYLDAIPSETSLKERLFFYFLTRELAPTGDVLELGTFLGGATRAMALGIQHSPRPGRRLVTLDAFGNYYDAATFRKRGVKIPGDVADGDMVPFLDVFRDLHERESYFPIIDVWQMHVADLPEQTGDYRFLERPGTFQAVLVDGCKSWFSVRDFFSNIAGRIEPGAYVAFQDYGRYTCFWIPVFTELFPEHFERCCSVSSTQVFRLARALDRKTIAARFPERPQDFDPATADRVFAAVRDRQERDGRAGAAVTARIQAAAFQAYIGNLDEARRRLTKLRADPSVRGTLRNRVDEALISPTYTPEGRIRL